MVKTLVDKENPNLSEVYQEFAAASPLTKAEKAKKLMGQIDLCSTTQHGLSAIYEIIGDLGREGIFKGSAWADPTKLVPGLVNGTLKSGHPNSTIELLSELRLLALAKGNIVLENISKEEAENFVQEVIISNLEFVFNEPLEETRLIMSEHELRKVHLLFQFLTERTQLDNIKSKLAEELTLICEQRPVVTEKQRKIIALVKEKISLDPNEPGDKKLLSFQRNIYRPTENTISKNPTTYLDSLPQFSNTELYLEAQQMGRSMLEYGLVSQYQAVLLTFLIKNNHRQIVPVCLGLNAMGETEWNEYSDFIADLILKTIHVYNAQCIYGLAKMLEAGLFSREAVRSGLFNISTIIIHPEVEERILKSTRTPHESVSAKQYLLGALFRIVGQPLGVGQGNNPTCQSARGISMWSMHAPAKLINMVQTAATYNDISFRFEDKEIKASETGKGLVQKLDHNLDAVSVTLVPMLDRIYNEMMLRATGRWEDPHKWVNPALYGQWIPIGFASAYDYLSNSILDFEGFIRIFYAMCHPEFNGANRLIYPNPLGIFITSAKGDMLGYHAISLLRVSKNEQGQYRAYFLNPNNEGRQDWGQKIRPSVFGHGENNGESSLPIHELASRVYAFHFNTLEVFSKLDSIPQTEVDKVKNLAQESWGRSYIWLETKKKW